MAVNRKAEKYTVTYAVPALADGQRARHTRHFNCVTKAMKFASHYPATLRLPGGRQASYGNVWCSFHQQEEPAI